jgi:hypothetical protein
MKIHEIDAMLLRVTLKGGMSFHRLIHENP